jgi:stage V sporulation protein SpoVS
MKTQNTSTVAQLRNEIANCNQAIKAFALGMKWLAPDGLNEAPSIAWLQMQKRICLRQIFTLKGVEA